jgi:hypothetical protein
MNIRLQPGQTSRLVEIAAHRGVTAEKLVREIILRYFEEDEGPDKIESSPNHRGGLGTEIAALFPKHGPRFRNKRVRSSHRRKLPGCAR